MLPVRRARTITCNSHLATFSLQRAAPCNTAPRIACSALRSMENTRAAHSLPATTPARYREYHVHCAYGHPRALDGKRSVLEWSGARLVYVWDVQSREVKQIIPAHTGALRQFRAPMPKSTASVVKPCACVNDGAVQHWGTEPKVRVFIGSVRACVSTVHRPAPSRPAPPRPIPFECGRITVTHQIRRYSGTSPRAFAFRPCRRCPGARLPPRQGAGRDGRDGAGQEHQALGSSAVGRCAAGGSSQHGWPVYARIGQRTHAHALGFGALGPKTFTLRSTAIDQRVQQQREQHGWGSIGAFRLGEVERRRPE